MQNRIGVLMIIGGAVALWAGKDTQAALGLLAIATGLGHMIVARTRRPRRQRPHKRLPA